MENSGWMTTTEWRELNKVKKNKYGAKSKTIDGIRFDSTFEGEYYCKLKILRDAGEVAFERQVTYKIVLEGIEICSYRADFVVTWVKTGKVEVIDCKGVITPIYRLKKKLMKAVFGIEIKEVFK